ncbi:olfactory receptor-like protein DTMT [Rhinatrema bivittatum]|uniref:olfactory receptor-like protein DTMT n=1 Tax=Rhinatrema bivittatum TaxID=194408 RepID=UPI00112969B0|nr:olfactory receptor-like protein DTMT [Rhinatrema bivittatum]
MANRNETSVTSFILLGLVPVREQRIVLFVTFLIMYLITLLGNGAIIAVIRLNSRLHIPMYFFLSVLSSVDICFISVTVPNLLQNLLSESKTISFAGCLTQVYFLTFIGGAECFLLAAMAYDRYVAICYPLQYSLVMNSRLCHWLVTVVLSCASSVLFIDIKCQEMENRNETSVTSFILLGLVPVREQRIVLFVMFLIMYLITLLGNSAIIAVIRLNSHLHIPMYFFLSVLSSVDICFISVTVPNLLQNLLSESKTISFAGCLTQVYFLIFIGGAECFLLAAMAYDRYVAICYPLQYSLVMNSRLCHWLVTGCFVGGGLKALLHTLMLLRLSFCSFNIINHVFCDLTGLYKLSCTDTSLNELMIFIEGPFSLMLPFVIIVLSYCRIITAILKMSSAAGMRKAFSTCSSHLTVVSLFYVSVIVMYVRPSSAYSPEKDKVVAVVYVVVTPMLNPFIYSLRNNEMKDALRRTMLINLGPQNM